MHRDGKKIILLEVGAAFGVPIRFERIAYVRRELLGVTEALELVSRLPPKDDRTMQLEQLRGMRLIERTGGDHWSITNRAAILFARNLADFGVEYARRAPRVMFYKGDDRISTEREQPGTRGYALGL